MSEWKEMIKYLKEVSKDRKMKSVIREKAKSSLKNKKEFLKLYIKTMEVKEKEDIIKASEQYVRKIKREIKELIEWSKK